LNPVLDPRLIRRFFLALGLLALGLASCVSPGEGIAVHYVANEGFLIETGERKVLLDALFGDEAIDWCDTPDADLRARLAAARAPFEGIDLILVTHWHVDHFDADLVLQHLAADARPIVVASPQVVSRLRAASGWDERFAARIREVALDLHASTVLDEHGVKLAIHRVRHGRYMIADEATGELWNKHEAVENLAFSITVGTETLLHLGDAFLDQNPETFGSDLEWADRVDVLFFEGWTPESLELAAGLAPDVIVAMHLPPVESEMFERVASQLREAVPDIVIFTAPLEQRRFPRFGPR